LLLLLHRASLHITNTTITIGYCCGWMQVTTTTEHAAPTCIAK